jgi:DUF2934 family protein
VRRDGSRGQRCAFMESSMAVQSTSSARTARKSTTKKARSSAAQLDSRLDTEKRHALIAEAAYLRAERRGFTPGHEVEDWVAAETEIELALTASTQAPQ